VSGRGPITSLKKLRSLAHGTANAFAVSWEHYVRMLAETLVESVEIDLLRGTVFPPAFAIDRNEILARRLQDQVDRANHAQGLGLDAASLTLRPPAGEAAGASIDIAFASPTLRYEARFVVEHAPPMRVVRINEQSRRPGCRASRSNSQLA